MRNTKILLNSIVFILSILSCAMAEEPMSWDRWVENKLVEATVEKASAKKAEAERNYTEARLHFESTMKAFYDSWPEKSDYTLLKMNQAIETAWACYQAKMNLPYENEDYTCFKSYQSLKKLRDVLNEVK